MNDNIDPSADLDGFYDYVWNVDTAVGFGLDIWGRIVDVSRYLRLTGNETFFNFFETGASATSWNEAPFYPSINAAFSNYRLEDDAYRKLILGKALANISASDAPSINQLLQNFFSGRGTCYIDDLGGMEIQYVFEFDLTQVEYAIIAQSHIFPRPAGVSATFIGPDLVVHTIS